MRRRDRGFTLIEMTIAIFVIVIGLLALLGVFPAVFNVTRQSRETQVATSAARSQMDLMRAAQWPTLLTTYQNSTFAVPGLVSATGVPQGKVTFLSEAQAAAAFSQSVTGTGVPQLWYDLNLNQKYNETAAPDTTYIAFPVRVEISWLDEGKSLRTVTMTSILYNNNK